MSKEELRAYLARRGPERIAELGNEAQWALGLTISPTFHPPPEWVRKLIREIYGANGAKRKLTEAEALVVVARVAGASSALAHGARLLFAESKSGDEDGGSASEKQFKSSVRAAIQPAIENVESALTKLSPDIYKGNPDTFAAYTDAQAKVANEMAAESRDELPVDSLTEEVQHFLWTFWPEANTANSVHALYEWMMSMRIIHCSEKLLEKICGQIGFRASKRGRRKRIPTN